MLPELITRIVFPTVKGTRRRLRSVSFWLTGVLALSCLCAMPHPMLAQRASTIVVLAGGRVIQSPDALPLDDAMVVIVNGRIAAVGSRDRVSIPAGATMIDCTGLVIVAGFQNSHVHFTEEKWADAGTLPASKLTAQLQEMLTRYGFTTVVDTASLLANTLAIRRRIETGEIAGPRILTAGLAIYPPNAIPYYVKDVVPPDLLELLPQPATAALAVDAVRENLDRGADIIKLFTGSWVSRQEVVPMPAAIAAAAVTEAHSRGKLVFTHPSNVAGLEVALSSRVDVLAHAIDDPRGLTPDHLKRMKAQGVALVPTVKLLASDGRREVLDQIRDYARAGGQILFGTDVGYLPDYDPVREYELMEAAGLTWRQILASLTTDPASRFKEDARRGRLAQDMDADIVVLGADPLHGSRAFADVRYTIRAGRVLYQRRVNQ
jgi:imidazolonepropionase-like amidohydrolase